MVTKVLCVAEKPSIAKAVANHLSNNQVQTVISNPSLSPFKPELTVSQRPIPGNPYVKNYTFPYVFPTWGQCDVTMTSVLGHLLSHDFEARYRAWESCDPGQLFDARIETYVDDDKKPIAANIERQARFNDYLYIWTDCDRGRREYRDGDP